MNSMQKAVSSVLTVGISGVTCGGKSSLSNLLKAAFPRAAIVCQDDFYKDAGTNSNDPPSATIANWDTLDSLDMVSMTRTVRATLSELEQRAATDTTGDKKLLIIDGFLIFNYPPLAELCDLKYFFTLPFDDCRSRRSRRCYDSPDPPGYFTDVAWPMYVKHLEEMRLAAYADQIKYLDGTCGLQDNFDRVMRDVLPFFNVAAPASPAGRVDR